MTSELSLIPLVLILQSNQEKQKVEGFFLSVPSLVGYNFLLLAISRLYFAFSEENNQSISHEMNVKLE